MTTGPALGGLLVSALGAPIAVLADALTYLYSAAALTRIDVTEPGPKAGATTRHLLLEIRDGIRWVYRGSGLATLAIATHGWFIGNAIVGVVLAPYALDDLSLTPFQFGIIGAVGGVGALIGAAITTAVGVRLGTGRTIIACHVVTTGGVLVMVAAGPHLDAWVSFAVLAAGQGLYGLAMGMSNSHEMSFASSSPPTSCRPGPTPRCAPSTGPSWSSPHPWPASWPTRGGSAPCSS